MAQIQPPITYRPPPSFWIYGLLIICFLIFQILTHRENWPFPWIWFAAYSLIMIIYGLTTCLKIRADGVSYTNIFGSFETDWTEIEKLDTKEYIGTRSLRVYRKNGGYNNINIAWMNLRSEDVRQFLRLLKKNVPDIGMSQRVLDLMK